MAQKETPISTDSMHTAAPPAIPAAEDDDALRKRLLSRIAVAGVAIVGLLGGLAVYDALNKEPAPALPKMAAVPAEPVAPLAKLEEEKPAEAAAAEEKLAEPVAEPERTETPIALSPAKPLTPPAKAHTASIKPPPPVVALPVKPDAAREIARTVPESTRLATAPVAHAQAQQAPVQHAPASRPLTQAAETVRHFLVQVGVFSNHANAEELVSKLHEAGIPAQIESRVQVGPFVSRAEADAARAKLKAMGLDDGLLVRR
jgi:cell division protein FtsN